jgi:hypothetical protein
MEYDNEYLSRHVTFAYVDLLLGVTLTYADFVLICDNEGIFSVRNTWTRGHFCSSQLRPGDPRSFLLVVVMTREPFARGFSDFDILA